MYPEFDNYLSSLFSDDYWSDVGISIAEAKLYEFSYDDWITINEKWKDRDCYWVIRCAEVLGDFNNIKSMKLLIDFLNVNDSEVQIAALDSIGSLLSMGVVIENTDVSLIISKMNAIQSSSIVVNIMLNSLSDKLK